MAARQRICDASSFRNIALLQERCVPADHGIRTKTTLSTLNKMGIIVIIPQQDLLATYCVTQGVVDMLLLTTSARSGQSWIPGCVQLFMESKSIQTVVWSQKGSSWCRNGNRQEKYIISTRQGRSLTLKAGSEPCEVSFIQELPDCPMVYLSVCSDDYGRDALVNLAIDYAKRAGYRETKDLLSLPSELLQLILGWIAPQQILDGSKDFTSIRASCTRLALEIKSYVQLRPIELRPRWTTRKTYGSDVPAYMLKQASQIEIDLSHVTDSCKTNLRRFVEKISEYCQSNPDLKRITLFSPPQYERLPDLEPRFVKECAPLDSLNDVQITSDMTAFNRFLDVHEDFIYRAILDEDQEKIDFVLKNISFQLVGRRRRICHSSLALQLFPGALQTFFDTGYVIRDDRPELLKNVLQSREDEGKLRLLLATGEYNRREFKEAAHNAKWHSDRVDEFVNSHFPNDQGPDE